VREEEYKRPGEGKTECWKVNVGPDLVGGRVVMNSVCLTKGGSAKKQKSDKSWGRLGRLECEPAKRPPWFYSSR